MKVMICQPMNGKDDETIKAERQGIVEMLGKQGHSVVNTIFSEEPPFLSKNRGLWCMGKSLIAMSEVDVLYCMKGWEKARGCIIEHACAVNYGIDVWYEEGEELEEEYDEIKASIVSEASTEGERGMTGWQTGIPTKDGLYVIQIHPYGSMNRNPTYACYYIKNGVLKDCIDTDPIEPKSFWEDYAIKWMKISY